MVSQDERKLYRRVSDKPQFIKADGSVSSALFKDSHGVSVDKEDERTEALVIEDEVRMHQSAVEVHSVDSLKSGERLRAICYVTRQVCMDQGTIVKDDPVEGNEHHALILRSESIAMLTKGQARSLARNAVVVRWF